MSHLGFRRKAGLIALMAGLSCFLLTAVTLAGYEPDPSAARSDIPEDYQWNPHDIFPDNDAWKAELEAIGVDIPGSSDPGIFFA